MEAFKKDPNKLDEGIPKETGEESIECDCCRKVFNTGYGLHIHKSKMHNSVQDEALSHDTEILFVSKKSNQMY